MKSEEAYEKERKLYDLIDKRISKLVATLEKKHDCEIVCRIEEVWGPHHASRRSEWQTPEEIAIEDEESRVRSAEWATRWEKTQNLQRQPKVDLVNAAKAYLSSIDKINTIPDHR